MKRYLLIAVVFSLMALNVSADVPRFIDYQGRLMDASGKPVTDGNYIVIINLYDSTQATKLWTNTYSAVPTKNGYFSLTLGDPTTQWNSLDFNQQYYIGTQIGGDAQELSPRQVWNAVPYAIKACTANTANAVANNCITTANIVQGADLPVGTILAWTNHLAGTPALPPQYMECNGQQILDSASPMWTKFLPNLNGAPGANSPGLTYASQMFLRGGTTSGVGQMDAFQGHNQGGNPNFASIDHSPPAAYIVGSGTALGFNESAVTTGPVSDGTNGTPRIAAETRPVNMSVIWIMKIR